MLVQGTKLSGPFYNSLQKYLDEHDITDYSPLNLYNAVAAIRAEKLPDPAKIPSAGSFFKNAVVPTLQILETPALENAPRHLLDDGMEKINSGWLIEDAGLAGKTLHGMEINKKAALVLINKSAESYADLAAARAEIVRTVQEKYGITLKQEPVEIEVKEKTK